MAKRTLTSADGLQTVYSRTATLRKWCERWSKPEPSEVREDAVSQPVQLSFPFFDTIMITTKQEAA